MLTAAVVTVALLVATSHEFDQDAFVAKTRPLCAEVAATLAKHGVQNFKATIYDDQFHIAYTCNNGDDPNELHQRALRQIQNEKSPSQ